jgi:hypothetical protein
VIDAMSTIKRFLYGFIAGATIFFTLWFGIRPIFTGFTNNKYPKVSRQNMKFADNEYGTIVIGSEPEGLASALSSARTGLKTLLITKDPDPGSYITRTMISKMDPQQAIINKKKILINGGVYQELFGKFNIGFSASDYEESTKKLLNKEKSLEVLYNTSVTEVIMEGPVLKSIKVKGPDGERTLKAHQFIDASQNGDLLLLCNTPYITGSADVGMPNTYEALAFNFRISGVDVESLKKSQKTSEISWFHQAIMVYGKENERVKIVSPSFITQGEDELVVTGLKVVGVNVEDEADVKAAYKEAEEEAILLTAYLKNVLTPFKNCTYKEGPRELFIPENRHFEGRYTLTVTDILENRNFADKIALCSAAVDAGRFVNQNVEYIVTKPNVYAIPLGCIVPTNLDNVMMTGSKASFSSLASTSASSLPTRMTVGESAGLIAAYSFINQTNPGKLTQADPKEIKALVSFLKRGGIVLQDFEESLLIPNTEERLMDHWAYPYVRTLAEYGIIAGNTENDFKLDFRASQELFTVLMRNTMLKLAPDQFSKEIDARIKAFESKTELTGERAGVIILKALDLPYEQGKALDALKAKKILPEALTSRLSANDPVTLDVVFGLAVETVDYLKAQK